jgi:hypothetical protein
VASELPVVVEILHVPECPLLPAAREAVDRAAASLGAQVHIEEVAGAFPSPSVVVGGSDVSGRSMSSGACCRLDLPTDEQLRGALHRAMSAQRRESS